MTEKQEDPFGLYGLGEDGEPPVLPDGAHVPDVDEPYEDAAEAPARTLGLTVAEINALSPLEFKHWMDARDAYESQGSVQVVDQEGELSEEDASLLLTSEPTEESVRAAFEKARADKELAEYTEFFRDENAKWDAKRAALKERFGTPEPTVEDLEPEPLNFFERLSDAQFADFLKARDQGRMEVGVSTDEMRDTFSRLEADRRRWEAES